VGEFVERLHRTIREISDKPHVAIELVDGSRFVVESIVAEPGYGFVTLRPHPKDEPPDAIVVPVGALRRIEVHRAAETEAPFGFSLPSAE
jgi:hypothetical protein